MTQAAVSYQIRMLEERVGAPLFLRRPRQVALTEAGQRLAPAVTEALYLLREAYAAARGGAQGMLVVSTLLTFASNWLAQHLGSFQLAHPALAVRLDTSNRLVDFAREEIDVAIRSGGGKWPGMAVHQLFHADFTPMLSPKLAATHRRRATSPPTCCACRSSIPATPGGRNGSPPPAAGRRNWPAAGQRAWARRPTRRAPPWPARASPS